VATSSNVLDRVRATAVARALAPIAVLAVVLAGVTVGNGAATAAPTRDIKQVEDQILALQQDAADAADQWNEAKAKQADIATKISALKVRIAAAELAYGKVSGAVDAMARAAYATGGIDPSLQALLADNPQAFLDQTAALDQVARSQGTSLRRTESARLLLAQLKVQLDQQKTAAAAAAADTAAKKQSIDDKLAAAQALLSSLKADERAKLAALAAAKKAADERAARIAEARAAAAARAAQKPAPRTSHRGSTSGGGNPGATDGGGGAGSGGGSPSSRARQAVAYALSKVGHRYVAGADGPGSFDCSGLTMAAWRSAGVSLPHYSKAQYGATRHISRSELRPGDLLFYFGNGAHHVSMYIGGGMMVSASNPGAGVEIIAAWGPWYGSRYSGAGRVV
jgi:cell wall-associated NlpC family hydrolase